MDAMKIAELGERYARDIRDLTPRIPEHMVDGLVRYIVRGVPGGHFLTAVLSNDFMEACGRADADNLDALRAWAAVLYNAAPRGCYGSAEAVSAWIKHGGLDRLNAAEAA